MTLRGFFFKEGNKIREVLSPGDMALTVEANKAGSRRRTKAGSLMVGSGVQPQAASTGHILVVWN